MNQEFTPPDETEPVHNLLKDEPVTELMQVPGQFVHQKIQLFFDSFTEMTPYSIDMAKDNLHKMKAEANSDEIREMPALRTALIGSLVGARVAHQIASYKYFVKWGKEDVLADAGRQDPELVAALDQQLFSLIKPVPVNPPDSEEMHKAQDELLASLDEIRRGVRSMSAEDARSKRSLELFLIGMQFGAARKENRHIFANQLADTLK